MFNSSPDFFSIQVPIQVEKDPAYFGIEISKAKDFTNLHRVLGDLGNYVTKKGDIIIGDAISDDNGVISNDDISFSLDVLKKLKSLNEELYLQGISEIKDLNNALGLRDKAGELSKAKNKAFLSTASMNS